MHKFNRFLLFHSVLDWKFVSILGLFFRGFKRYSSWSKKLRFIVMTCCIGNFWLFCIKLRRFFGNWRSTNSIRTAAIEHGAVLFANWIIVGSLNNRRYYFNKRHRLRFQGYEHVRFICRRFWHSERKVAWICKFMSFVQKSVWFFGCGTHGNHKRHFWVSDRALTFRRQIVSPLLIVLQSHFFNRF